MAIEQRNYGIYSEIVIAHHYIPDAGPCPDRFASGVGVPPDENRRPMEIISH